MPVFETEMADAARAGRSAALAGRGRDTNPHTADTGTPARVLAAMWSRGWDDGLAARFPILDDDSSALDR